MPFQSKAQAREMFANQPAIAKRWAAMTPSIRALPNHSGGNSHHEGSDGHLAKADHEFPVRRAAIKRLRKAGLANEQKHLANANKKTPFDLPGIEQVGPERNDTVPGSRGRRLK